MNFSHKRPNDFCLRDTFGGPSEVEDVDEGEGVTFSWHILRPHNVFVRPLEADVE